MTRIDRGMAVALCKIMSYTRVIGLASVLLLTSACRGQQDPGASESFHSEQAELTEGTPKAMGVLAFLNDETTTLSVLDHDVALDKRAAENLIGFRAGPDGTLNTGDDVSFRTIEEVDAVRWVGPAALNRITAYAETHGWIPRGDDVLGEFEGVLFTVTQAEATLKLANEASYLVLDDDVSLDSRAVDGIFAARPIASLLELANAYYVGKSALLDLREFTSAPPPGLDNGASCDSSNECASGLCVGETLGWGMCDEASMADNFTWDEADEIPDGNDAGMTLSMNIQGLATVPVDVVVTIDIDHPNKEDLIVALHQPGGGYEVLWDRQANPPMEVSAGWGIERDNMVNGVWTLEIIDTVTGNAGEFRGANLYLSSRWD